MRQIGIILFILAFYLITGCYEKQDHQVTFPVWPNYTISGQVVDADNSAPLEGVQLSFQAAQQLYDCDTKVFTISSDENGRFEQSDVCPGFYTLNLLKNDLIIQQQRFSLQHQDTTLALELPKIVIGELILSEPDIDGFVWRNADSLAFISKWISTTNNQATFTRIFEGALNSVFRTAVPYPLTNEYPDLAGLAKSDSFYYSFGGGFSEPTIFLIADKSHKIKGNFAAPHRLSDITNDGEIFWATTTRQSIVKWRLNNPESVQEFKSPGNHPRGIAWDSSNLWTADEGQYGFPRLYKHKQNMEIDLTFSPVAIINGSQTLLLPEYMDFSPNGSLWCVALLPSGDKGLFQFTLP
jgi:hypothetical protein